MFLGCQTANPKGLQVDGHQPGRFACDGGGQPQDLEAPNKGPVYGWMVQKSG